MKPCIGLIDSGVGRALQPWVGMSRCFDGERQGDDAEADRLRHGDLVARLVVQQCPSAELLIAQVFTRSLQAPTARIAEAIGWLVEGGAQLINMSFGLARPSYALAEACRHAAERGVVLFASAPSCGAVAVYPAGLSDCIAVTGDPRCAEAEIAWLGQRNAAFGACPMLVPGRPGAGGGSSFACARVTGIAGRLLSRHGDGASLLTELKAAATFMGPEERRA